MLQFMGNLAHIVPYNLPLIHGQMQGLIGSVRKESILSYLLCQRCTVQEIRMEKQGIRFRHRAILDTLDAYGLPRRKTDNGFIIIIVFRFPVIDGTSDCLFQEKGIKAKYHPVRIRLFFRTVEMHDAD